MRRIRNNRISKKALTLVELVVAMALTVIFAGACIMLIFPISKIYNHINDLNRAQVLADTVVDSLRAECSRTYITGQGDVWIASTGNIIRTSHDELTTGDVLVIRRSYDYCETLFANSDIPSAICMAIKSSDEAYTNGSNLTSRAIYRLFNISGDDAVADAVAISSDVDAGYVHFGYFVGTVDSGNYFCPAEYYDFTNPFGSGAYGDYQVDLEFSDITYSGTNPAFVSCTVSIIDPETSTSVYSRTTVLCFASPVVQ